MKIPTSIQLHGKIIVVKYSDKLLSQEDCCGLAKYRTSEIILQKLNAATEYSEADQEEWFCHEVVHHILNQMHEYELKSNEKFVSVFANLLQQALSTAVYK